MATKEAAFKLRVIGRSPAHITGNENHVSACLLAGPDKEHLTLAGTLTMTEMEWDSLVRALRKAGDAVAVEDWTEQAL
ncbi:MAG: hypothetical protein ABR505_06650 [Actinomycetota bacterium]